MLILRRKPGESLVLFHPAFGEIALRVYAIEGNKVKLGIDAPATVEIARSEVIIREDVREHGHAPKGLYKSNQR
jgi:carbon storage regulator CsrA